MPILHGTLLNPASPDNCIAMRSALVQIDEKSGRFIEVDARSAGRKPDYGDAGTWILPGFIDAHLHLPQWDRRGIEGGPLFDWYEKVVWPAERRLANADFAERLAEEFVSGLISRGTTTAVSFGSPFYEATERAFQVFARRGLRAIHGMMLNDANCPHDLRQPADAALEQSRALAARWHRAENDRLRYAFSPRMTVSCSERMLRGAAALASMLDCHIQTHVAESPAEVAAARGAFPERLDDIDVLSEMGLLTPRTLLGHAVVLSQPQRKQVAAAGATVVHCPSANLFLESGMMDYGPLADAGVHVALGSGVGGGPEPFMPHVAAEFLQTTRAMKTPWRAPPTGVPPLGGDMPAGSHMGSAARAWWLLTRGAAEALGLGGRVGAVEPGMEADCLVVRPEPWIAELPAEQQISALLYTLMPEQIEQVFIAGRRVK